MKKGKTDGRTYSCSLNSGGLERLGFAILCASMFVSMIILGIVIHLNRDIQRTFYRAEGQRLARTFPQISIDDQSRLDLVRICLQAVPGIDHDPNFAYLVVLNAEGTLNSQVVQPGVKLPTFDHSLEPAFWYSQRTLPGSGLGSGILEFSAPLLNKGELAGLVVLGLTEPGYELHGVDGRLLAGFSLPVLLLGALFYFVFKRETQPVMELSQDLRRVLSDRDGFKLLDVKLLGPYRDLVGQLNFLLNNNRQHIKDLKKSQISLVATDKVNLFHKGRLEVILEKLPDGVVVMEGTGRVAFANCRIGGVIGITRQQMIGRNYQEWCHDESLTQFLGQFQETKGGRHHAETMEYHPSALADRTVAVISSPLVFQEESALPIGTLFLFRDVTTEVLSKTSQDEFVAQVAHELKTPLGSIRMYSEMLLGQGKDDKDFQIEAINAIYDETDRLTTLINSLLIISKIEVGQPVQRQRVRIGDLLRDAFDTVARSERGNDLTFHIDLPHEMTPLFVDKELMYTAVKNLLTNAVKYNRPGGQVVLSAEETEQTVTLRVRDTGIGIAAEERQRVFEKFYRSESDQVRALSGHGLGLALARKIVDLHQGQLSIVSELGQGSEFTIELQKSLKLTKEGV